MGCTARDKHIRTTRRARSASRSDVSSDASQNQNSLQRHLLHHHEHNPQAIPNSSMVDESTWDYCTEDQLEEILMKNLEFLYKEAVAKLVGLGYDEDVAVKAILTNGHGYYGGMDVLTNILHNALAYLNGKKNVSDGNTGSCDDSGGPVFTSFRQLEEYSLAGMVCLLQQVRPHLSRGDAMWCLLMSDLHVGRASSIETPLSGNENGINDNGCGAMLPNPEGLGNCNDGGAESNCGNGVGAVAPALCRFHGGRGFGGGGNSDFMPSGIFSSEMGCQNDIECPKRFNLSPAMKSLLKRNVALFAAGFRANTGYPQAQAQVQSQSCFSMLSSADGTVNGGASLGTKCDEPHDARNVEGLSSMLSKFRELNLDQTMESAGEEKRDEMIFPLLHKVEELEKQVKERKEWAYQKAMQAARKLSNDLTELKLLRMEREETQRLKKGKQTLEDVTMKRLSEMENALRKASGQVDRANAAVRRLETENAEIRAEMEASKLSASESVTTCLEVAKREKKCLKKLLAWEKQRAKLQEDLTSEKEKINDIERTLNEIEQSQKDAEEKWRNEVKLKEEALHQMEEERRSKEAAEVESKRKLEALRLKIEIDFQRHKDDHQRLEQELSRLKSSIQSEEMRHQSNPGPFPRSELAKSQNGSIYKLLNQLDQQDDSSEKGSDCDRDCIICEKEEVSVVFLPCAHQVVCASCSDGFGKKGKSACPCCRIPIDQKIRVFGASS